MTLWKVKDNWTPRYDPNRKSKKKYEANCRDLIKGHRRYFLTEEEAWAYREDLETRYEKISGGLSLSKLDPNILLSDFCNVWLTEYRDHYTKEVTYWNYFNALRRYVFPSELGSIPVYKVTVAQRKRFERVLLHDRKLAPGTVRLVRTALSNVFAFSIECQLRETNPCKSIGGARDQLVVVKSITTRTVFPKDEMESVLSVCRRADELLGTQSPIIAPGVLIATMLSTGLRPGEAPALKIDDVLLDRKLLHIHRNQELFPRPDPISGKQRVYTKIGPLKNARWYEFRGRIPERFVPLELPEFPGFFSLLSEYVSWIREESFRMGWADGWLFPRDDGNRFSHKWTGMYALKALCKRADVPRRSPYACRHTFASVLLTAGYPAVEVAEYLGDRVSIVLDSYAHFIPETRVSRDQNRDQSSDSPARISNLDAGIPFQEGKPLISTS